LILWDYSRDVKHDLEDIKEIILAMRFSDTCRLWDKASAKSWIKTASGRIWQCRGAYKDVLQAWHTEIKWGGPNVA
jgi:phosphoribosylaminoimidazole-succinocarboxamide synthase